VFNSDLFSFAGSKRSTKPFIQTTSTNPGEGKGDTLRGELAKGRKKQDHFLKIYLKFDAKSSGMASSYFTLIACFQI
jgi:hypothetical protein